jgi:hypothetical protein
MTAPEGGLVFDGEILDLTDEETVLFILRFGLRLASGLFPFSERTRRRVYERRGLRLAELLKERRRELTLHLLATDLPVKTVALRLGFSSLQTFARYVRREYGMTATAVRTRLRDGGKASGPSALPGAPGDL